MRFVKTNLEPQFPTQKGAICLLEEKKNVGNALQNIDFSNFIENLNICFEITQVIPYKQYVRKFTRWMYGQRSLMLGWKRREHPKM